MLDCVIKEAKIVNHTGHFEGEIGIKDGRITQVAKSIEETTDRKFNTHGKIVLPGLVDGHTHMEFPFMGTVTADDFETGTVASACGGVTTIIDFSIQPKGSSLLETYELWRKKADSKVCVDYSLHMVIREANQANLKQIRQIIRKGVQSVKLFMTYRRDGLLMSDINIYRIMKEVAKYGGVVGLHCENNDYIECLVSEFLAAEKTEPFYHAKSRPPEAEVEAVRRATTLAGFADANMYVVHMSTRGAMESVVEARNRGLDVYAETCPHYLTFTEDAYRGPAGKNYVMSPPLRRREDKEALWLGLASGQIRTVASDHCCFTSEQKDMGKEDFSRIPNGVPGTEVILPILYHGVSRGLISLERLVQLTSYNPARQFGLFPRKGTIQVGSDADIVVLDPKKRQRLTKDNLHSRMDNSIYERITVTGFPVLTLARGRVVHEDGQFVGKRGGGSYVPGRPHSVRPKDL